MMYGIRKKGENIIPNDLKELTERQEKITITEEGITEVISYMESHSGVKSDIKTIDIKIDRTPPIVGELEYTKLSENKVKMRAKDTSDAENGSGMGEYIFLTNNKTGEQIISSSPRAETTLENVKDKSLVTLIAVDNAGNYATGGNAYGELTYPSLYQYSVYGPNTSGSRDSKANWHQIAVEQEINAYLPIRNSAELMKYPTYIYYCKGTGSGHFDGTTLTDSNPYAVCVVVGDTYYCDLTERAII